MTIYKKNKSKLGWTVQLGFVIGLHEKDKAILEIIQRYWGVGKIYKLGQKSVQYKVQSLDELEVIILHLNKFPLFSQKHADFKLFEQAFKIIKNKEHLSLEGLTKLLAIRASLNLGLSTELKSEFAHIIPITRPLVPQTKTFDPYWLVGFTSAEGCFLIDVYKAQTKLGEAVKLVFQLTQHSRDEELMNKLVEYFGCGSVHINDNILNYRVKKFSDLTDKIIPIFQKYPILGVKAQDYKDFCEVANIMKEKGHLTIEGLNQIKKIKAGMNKGR
jgi:hypothetical protein